MPRESQLWRVVRDALRGQGCVKRIENVLEDGTPDVTFTFCGKDGWLELKDVDGWPSRWDTVVPLRHYTAAQRGWHRTWAAAGGRIFVLVRVRGHGATYTDDLEPDASRADDEFFLFSGAEAAEHLGFAWNQRDWRQATLWNIEGRIDGKTLATALTR